MTLDGDGEKAYGKETREVDKWKGVDQRTQMDVWLEECESLLAKKLTKNNEKNVCGAREIKER